MSVFILVVGRLPMSGKKSKIRRQPERRMSETKTKYVSRSKRWPDANESVLIESTDGSDFFDAGNGQGRSDGRWSRLRDSDSEYDALCHAFSGHYMTLGASAKHNLKFLI